MGERRQNKNTYTDVVMTQCSPYPDQQGGFITVTFEATENKEVLATVIFDAMVKCNKIVASFRPASDQ